MERVRKKMRPEVERGDYIMWNLWLGSWLVALWQSLGSPYPTDLARFTASGRAIGWLLFLPCAAIILRRPNVGEVPAWLDLDKGGFKGTVKAQPAREDITMPIQEQLIVELYSK